MALTPTYAGAIKTTSTTGSTANALRDGTGTLVPCFTAGTNGSRISRISISARSTTTAGAVRFFVTTSAGTPAYRYGEPIGATTPSATVEPFTVVRTEDLNPNLLPINLASGQSLSWSTQNAEAFNVFIEGADY